MRNTEACNGCGACYNVCPHQAIVMETDRAGFLKFRKDTSLCVKCGRCDKACDSLSSVWKKPYKQKVFAAWAKSDEVHSRGNSGGLFEIAARSIFQMGGVVAGAAYAEDFSVKLMIAEREDQLTALIGSKFVQSNPGYVYNDLKKHLDMGRYALFVGAPCQVKALYAVLQKEYPKLIVAQFPCFGMPPDLFWKKYLEQASQNRQSSLLRIGSEVQLDHEINSRYMVLTWQDGEVCSEKADTCMYIKAWNNGYAISDVCALCRDNLMPLQSDLVWGNFWHIGEIEKFSVPKDLYQNGVSMLLVNSEQGEAFLEIMKPELVVYPRKFVEAAAPHFVFQSSGKDHFLFKRKYANKKRQEFQKDLANLSYEKLNDKYFSKREKNKDILISRHMGPRFAAWGWRTIYYLQKVATKIGLGS